MALGSALEVVHAQRPLDLAGQASPAGERGCHKGRFVVPAENCELGRVLHHFYRLQPVRAGLRNRTVNPPNGGGSQRARLTHGLVTDGLEPVSEARAVRKREIGVELEQRLEHEAPARDLRMRKRQPL